MKKNLTFYFLTISTILLSNLSYGQIEQRDKIRSDIKVKESINLVEELDKPVKIWHDGYWIIKHDGSRVWKKGYWRFEERSFEHKSKILRRKMTGKNKV